jgi:ABC-type antimicrobial peptide transport system permease subunit
VTLQGTDVISASTVLSAVIGTALLVAVIAFGLGAIIRHTAGTITTVGATDRRPPSGLVAARYRIVDRRRRFLRRQTCTAR